MQKILILLLSFLFVSCFTTPKKKSTDFNHKEKIKSTELVKVRDISEYETISESSNGLRQVTKNRKHGFIDDNDNLVVDLKYDVAWKFENGLARVCKRYSSDSFDDSGFIFKYGFINTKGKEIIPLVYDRAYPFENGKAEVEVSGQTVYIDQKGNLCN